MERIDLDANATVPVLPGVWDAIRPFTEGEYGNPSSAHSAGRRARRALDAAREVMAGLLGAFPDEVIFTSGATESNNLALFGLSGTQPSRILTSRLEHPCVIGPIEELSRRGWAVGWVPVSPRGQVTASEFRSCWTPETRIAAVQLVNHETGAIQPVAEITSSIPSCVFVHCDGAQAVGKLPINFRRLGVTTFSLSGHKFGGPGGVGALIVRRDTSITPRFWGGHQQKGLRPGSEPVALAVGMTKALETVSDRLVPDRIRLESLRTQLFRTFQQTAAPVVLNGPELGAGDVVPGTLNVSFPGCRADLLLMALDLAGVACSTGSACSSGSLLPSPVLRAMGVPDDVLRSAVRFSFTAARTPDEIAEAGRRIALCVTRIRAGGS